MRIRTRVAAAAVLLAGTPAALAHEGSPHFLSQVNSGTPADGIAGTVSVNTDSEAYYLNAERDGNVEAPESADSNGEPRWKQVSKTGGFEWHDHRMHWMSEEDPEQVEDKDAPPRSGRGDRTACSSPWYHASRRWRARAIAVLLASGIVQGLVEVRTLTNLVGTAFGRAVLIKVIVFAAIVALGAVNRRHLLPALAATARDGARSGRAGLLLRRTLTAELALGVVALAVTEALAGTHLRSPRARARSPGAATSARRGSS